MPIGTALIYFEDGMSDQNQSSSRFAYTLWLLVADMQLPEAAIDKP
jgi:predicted metal-dependent peptidase